MEFSCVLWSKRSDGNELDHNYMIMMIMINHECINIFFRKILVFLDGGSEADYWNILKADVN